MERQIRNSYRNHIRLIIRITIYEGQIKRDLAKNQQHKMSPSNSSRMSRGMGLLTLMKKKEEYEVKKKLANKKLEDTIRGGCPEGAFCTRRR